MCIIIEIEIFIISYFKSLVKFGNFWIIDSVRYICHFLKLTLLRYISLIQFLNSIIYINTSFKLLTKIFHWLHKTMSPKIFCMPLKDNKEHKVGIGEEGICFHPLIISHLSVFSSVFHDSIRLFVHLLLLLGVSFGLPILQTLNKNTYQSYRIVPFSLSVSSFWQDTTHFQLYLWNWTSRVYLHAQLSSWAEVSYNIKDISTWILYSLVKNIWNLIYNFHRQATSPLLCSVNSCVKSP